MNSYKERRRSRYTPQKPKKEDTSWNEVSRWYEKTTGESGHYYQEFVIFPGIKKIFPLSQSSKILDLGCGQGVFSCQIPKQALYTGYDLSPQLIQYAKSRVQQTGHEFYVSDVSKPIQNLKINTYSHAVIILALQNIESMTGVFRNAYDALEDSGKFLIVLNHPYFRIPRQSSWEIDTDNQIQYRRVNRYYSPLKVPVVMNPGQKSKQIITWSFHHPLETYITNLCETGFVIESIQEWCSQKVSQGKAAKMENRAREEFPMFMAIVARKDVNKG